MILPQEGEAARNLSIPELFGATADDADQLRIVSLVEVLAVGMCEGRLPTICACVCRHKTRITAEDS